MATPRRPRRAPRAAIGGSCIMHVPRLGHVAEGTGLVHLALKRRHPARWVARGRHGTTKAARPAARPSDRRRRRDDARLRSPGERRLHDPRGTAHLRGGFAKVLASNESPAAPDAACYEAFVAAKVDPAVGLAIFRKESTFGKKGGPTRTGPGATSAGARRSRSTTRASASTCRGPPAPRTRPGCSSSTARTRSSRGRKRARFGRSVRVGAVRGRQHPGRLRHFARAVDR